LERTGGNRSQAAQLLDISYKALVYKIRGYALDSE
jgi:DNA-binding NtrC family response regulator